MAGKPRRNPKVNIRWENRLDDQGLDYAILRWSEGGQRQSRTLGHVTEATAEQQRGDLEARLRLGLSSPSTTAPAPATVDSLVREYLRVLEDGQGRGGASYRRHEFLHCKRIGTHLGRFRADRLSEAHIRRMATDLLAEVPEIPADPQERMHRQRGMKRKSSVLDLLGCLRRVYRAGRDAGLTDAEAPRVPRNIVPDDRRAARGLTEAEVSALVEGANRAVGGWFGRVLLFLAWCPRRPIAVFALTRADCARALDETVSRKAVQLQIRRDKAGRGRGLCPLAEPALNVLREQLSAMADTRPEALVWTSARGRPLNASLVSPQLRRAAAAAGLEDVNLYDLRKFGASVIYAKTHDLEITRAYTGHEDVHTLLARYISPQRGTAEDLAVRLTWTAPALRMVSGGDA